MINFSNQVPSVYPSASRDFQYLCWLINIVLNSVKHNVDGIYDLPNNKADPRIAELLAMTLGFKVRRNYDQKQLAALASIIPGILRHKGTETAIRMAGEALLTASGADGMFDCEVKGSTLEVLLPKDLVDSTLFIDLLPYILPAGMTCRIIRKTQIKNAYITEVQHQDVLMAKWHTDVSWDSNNQTSIGLAGLFNVDAEGNKPNFANYHDNASLNTGLLDNTVIPTLDPNNILTDPKTNPKTLR